MREAEVEKLLENSIKAMESDAVQAVGEWETGMFCGLEDRNITDRYVACLYGYDQAIEKVREWVIAGFDQALTLLRAKPSAGEFRKKWENVSCDFKGKTAKTCNLFQEAAGLLDTKEQEGRKKPKAGKFSKALREQYKSIDLALWVTRREAELIRDTLNKIPIACDFLDAKDSELKAKDEEIEKLKGALLIFRKKDASLIRCGVCGEDYATVKLFDCPFCEEQALKDTSEKRT